MSQGSQGESVGESGESGESLESLESSSSNIIASRRKDCASFYEDELKDEQLEEKKKCWKEREMRQGSILWKASTLPVQQAFSLESVVLSTSFLVL